MGQIIFNEQKPKYANKLAITTGSKANEVLNENEIWLIDSTVDSPSSTDTKSSTGKGKYDKYIVGDGQTAAKDLPLLDIDPNVPTHLSQLIADENHKTVKEEDIQRWNTGTGGGGTPIESSDDITVINDAQQNINRLEFANKQYNNLNYSGFGKIHIKRNIQTVHTNDWILSDAEIISGSYVNLINTIGSKVGSIVTRSSMGYYKIPVTAGQIFRITGNKSDAISQTANWATRFWALSDEENNIVNCYKSDNLNFENGNKKEVAFINVEQNGYLWINFITYNNGTHIVETLEQSETASDKNILLSAIFTQEHTIYYIKDDFDLNKLSINIPNNSVLYFIGGSIKNGTIIGNKTTIVADKDSNIFGGNTTLLGTWNNTEWYPEWFGAVGDGVTDDTDAIQYILLLQRTIGSIVQCIMYGHTYRTTRPIYFTNNTYIKGGTIKAKFENQMGWILKTFNFMPGTDVVYGQNNPGALLSWQEHDHYSVAQVNGGTIEDLTLIGEYNEHYIEVIENEGEENESTTLVADGTYSPIFGGLCIMGSRSVNTRNVVIQGTAVGMGRGACLATCDDHLEVKALFVGFAGYAINGHSLRDCFINAYCRTDNTGTSTTVVTPYYKEYQELVTLPKQGYVYQNGGIDNSDENNKRPFFCNIQTTFSFSVDVDNPNSENLHESTEEDPVSLNTDNVLADGLSEIFLCATANSNVSLRHTWFESVQKSLVYLKDGVRVAIDSPYVDSKNDYDIYTEGTTANIVTLKNCDGDNGVRCAGKTTETYKKYNITNLTRVNVLDGRVSPYPTDDDRFYFLTSGSVVGLPVSVIPSSGTGALTDNTLNAASGTYYRFNYTVNTLIVNLPNMTGVSSLRPVILYVETGGTPSISFTSADNKTVTQYSNYEIDMNSKYEINCLYNGQKWVVAAAVID